MSELGSSMPSRADIMSVIGGLEGLRPAVRTTTAAAQPLVKTEVPGTPVVQVPPLPNRSGSTAAQAAQARHDQDAAALRDMTADRDAWRSAAQSLQTELWRQMDGLRSDADHQRAQAEQLRTEIEGQRVLSAELRAQAAARDGQIAHLSAAMTALLELAHARSTPTVAGPIVTSGFVAVTTPIAPDLVVPAEPAPTAAVSAAPDPMVASQPQGMDDVPATQPPAPPVDPDAAPMVIPSLAPDPRPPARPKPRRAVAPVAAVAMAAPVPTAAPVAATEPPAERPPEPVPAVSVEYTVLETMGRVAEILPVGTTEKKRRLRLG